MNFQRHRTISPPRIRRVGWCDDHSILLVGGVKSLSARRLSAGAPCRPSVADADQHALTGIAVPPALGMTALVAIAVAALHRGRVDLAAAPQGRSGVLRIQETEGANRPGAGKNQAGGMLSEPAWFYAVLGVSLKPVSEASYAQPALRFQSLNTFFSQRLVQDMSRDTLPAPARRHGRPRRHRAERQMGGRI